MDGRGRYKYRGGREGTVTVILCCRLEYNGRSESWSENGRLNLHCDCVVTSVAQWLRCCVTNQKVAGSIPDGVIGIFH